MYKTLQQIRVLVIIVIMITIGLCLFLFQKYNTKFCHSIIGTYVIKLLPSTKYSRQCLYSRPKSEKYALAFYQLMKDVHDALEYSNVEYWIDGGTLLGAIRHKGMIPWDDDLDIEIDSKRYYDFINKTCPILQKLGYKIVDIADYSSDWRAHYNHPIFKNHHFLRAVVPTELTPYKDKHHYIFMDIFFSVEHDNNVYPYMTRCYPIKSSDLNPLRKQYKFGSLLLWGPNNPFPYILSLYGLEWQKKGCVPKFSHILHSHSVNEEKTFTLTEDLLKPAMPTGPLQERVKNLLQNLSDVSNLPSCNFVPFDSY